MSLLWTVVHNFSTSGYGLEGGGCCRVLRERSSDKGRDRREKTKERMILETADIVRTTAVEIQIPRTRIEAIGHEREKGSQASSQARSSLQQIGGFRR